MIKLATDIFLAAVGGEGFNDLVAGGLGAWFLLHPLSTEGMCAGSLSLPLAQAVGIEGGGEAQRCWVRGRREQ